VAPYDDRLIARWRLRNQFLVAPLAASAALVVRSLLCVQAENTGQTAWAIACRSAGDRDLDALLKSGQVVRTHVLRPTWHYACAEDIGWLLELTAPRILRVTGQQLRQVHGLEAPAIAGAMDTVLATLTERGELTRAELAKELTSRGVGTDVERPGMFFMILLAHAELNSLICGGSPRDGEHTYAVFASRVTAARRLAREEALAELAIRYLAHHGPATERDLAYWASLTLTDARAGIAAVSDRLGRFDHDGRVYWHLADDGPPDGQGEPRGHILQILDEIYRGYQDSRWVLDTAGLLPRGRETATGMGLVDGQLSAALRRTVGERQVRFAGTAYRELSGAERQVLADAARRYGEFLGLDAELVLGGPS
jgi:Winged helix DNA-binding domain